MKKLFAFVFFCFLFFESFSQVKLPCDVGDDKYLCSDSVTLTTKSLLPGKWRVMNGGSGNILNPTSKSTLIANIKDPIIKVYWVNNDQSCADTLEIVQPKIGATSLIKSNLPHIGNELTLCYKDDWKANTLISQGKSFVAYALYDSKPSSLPNVYTDYNAFKGPIIFVNNDVNDGTIKVNYPNNSNEYWFLPVLYHQIGVTGPIIDSTCQITGTPFKIKYLDQISISKKEDCVFGRVELSISGGTNNYNILNFSPSSIFIDSTLLNIGQIKLSNILVKQVYGVDIKDDNGCLGNFLTKFSPCPACKTDVIYQKTYCITDSFPKPALKEGAGIGRLELVPNTETGLVFDSLTGAIDIQNSVPGNYVLRNYTSLSCAKQSFTDFNIELLDTIPLPLGESVDTLCMPNPKIGDIKNISAQLITWYNDSNEKLDPAIDPAIHGTIYYCTQSIKGCESAKKGVRIFSPTIKAPEGDTIQYICNKNIDFAQNVLFPFDQNVFWYNDKNQKIEYGQIITEGIYTASQFLGCESKNRLKVSVIQSNVQLPSDFTDSLFYCINKSHIVNDLTPNAKGSFWFDLPIANAALDDFVTLEQGTYYFQYKDSISKCKTEKQKVWVTLPDFNLLVKKELPYCGYENGKISWLNSNNQYLFELSNLKVDTVIKSLKSKEYNFRIYSKENTSCYLDTLISLECKNSDFQEILTPNKDGKNDFLILGLTEDYPLLKLKVFNRWGNLVFESGVPYQDNWNGEDYVGNPLPSGTYYYVVDKDYNSLLYSGFIEIVH
jgi:gliding motility-associated-like protein